jgi:hypothetical protein
MSRARRFVSAAIASATLAIAASPTDASAANVAALRTKIVAAFSTVKSYRLTVLGEARSLGVWIAPNRYEMTTEIGGGKPVRTVIVGSDYWTFSAGKWEHAGRISSNLDVDIAGVIRNAKANPTTNFTRAADQTLDGRRVGTFVYTFKNGTEETCNYDRTTYRVTRCKADEVTILYTKYNDATNRIAKVR